VRPADLHQDEGRVAGDGPRGVGDVGFETLDAIGVHGLLSPGIFNRAAPAFAGGFGVASKRGG
jgi:hypothetical protein